MIVEVCSRLHHRRPRPLSVGQILVGVWIGISNCRSCFILHVCPSLDGLLQVRFKEFSLGASWHVWFRASGLSVYAAFTPARMKPLKDSAREGRVNPKGIPCLDDAQLRVPKCAMLVPCETRTLSKAS
jgi:hypothetical protein